MEMPYYLVFNNNFITNINRNMRKKNCLKTYFLVRMFVVVPVYAQIQTEPCAAQTIIQTDPCAPQTIRHLTTRQIITKVSWGDATSFILDHLNIILE